MAPLLLSALQDLLRQETGGFPALVVSLQHNRLFPLSSTTGREPVFFKDTKLSEPLSEGEVVIRAVFCVG